MLIWSNNSIKKITEFINNAKNSTHEVAKQYMKKLVDYADILNIMPNIGKTLEFTLFNNEIKQVIFKKHRIIPQNILT